MTRPIEEYLLVDLDDLLHAPIWLLGNWSQSVDLCRPIVGIDSMTAKPKYCEFMGGPKNAQMMHVKPGQTEVRLEELQPSAFGFKPLTDGDKQVVTKTHIYREVEPGRFCYFGME